MDLYQAFLDNKGKQIESHAAILKKNSLKANNALVVYNATPPIDIKNLDVLEFFEDPNGETENLIGGGVTKFC